jgi:hypothetical protein
MESMELRFCNPYNFKSIRLADLENLTRLRKLVLEYKQRFKEQTNFPSNFMADTVFNVISRLPSLNYFEIDFGRPSKGHSITSSNPKDADARITSVRSLSLVKFSGADFRAATQYFFRVERLHLEEKNTLGSIKGPFTSMSFFAEGLVSLCFALTACHEVWTIVFFETPMPNLRNFALYLASAPKKFIEGLCQAERPSLEYISISAYFRGDDQLYPSDAEILACSGHLPKLSKLEFGLQYDSKAFRSRTIVQTLVDSEFADVKAKLELIATVKFSLETLELGLNTRRQCCCSHIDS